MTAPNETEVVVRLEPFESFYRREFSSLVGLAYALSGSRLAAEDLAQDALMVAHGRWDEVKQMERPDAWVRRVLSNMAVSSYRRRRSELKAITRLAGWRQQSVGEMEPEDQKFWAAVRNLPDQQAKAIALHYVDDLPVAEIAEVLDCSPSTAKVHLHRGRQTLAKKLQLSGVGT